MNVSGSCGASVPCRFRPIRVYKLAIALCWCSWMVCYAIAATGSEPESDQERLEQKITDLSNRIERRPNDASLYTARGDAKFLLHQFDDASDDYSQAIKLDDHSDKAYFGRGLALARAGFIEDGIRDLTIYLSRHPDSSLAFTKRGVRYLWLGDRVNAEHDLRKAVALNAQNAEAHDDLGVVLAQKKSYEEAIRHFQIAIKVEGDYQKAHHNLAMAYYLTGRDLLALQAVNDALALRPEDRDSLLLKATILESLGKNQEAAAIRENAEFLPAGNWSEHADVQ